MGRRIKLHNFNNLSKNLNISFYDINYVTNEDKFSCVKYMHSMYNTANLVKTLKMVTKKINASILNISKQDYEPVGSSVNFLITEEPVKEELVDRTCNLGHLDKSHIAIHTYPEYSKKTNISTIRLDFSISTCGLISPLKAINYLLEKFSKNNCADIIQIDYFVRGFTRTSKNKKIFIDHKPTPIYKFINKKFLSNYKIFNKNYDGDNLWMCKLVIEKFNPSEYFFNNREKKLSNDKKISNNIRNEIIKTITNEIKEIAQIS